MKKFVLFILIGVFIAGCVSSIETKKFDFSLNCPECYSPQRALGAAAIYCAFNANSMRAEINFAKQIDITKINETNIEFNCVNQFPEDEIIARAVKENNVSLCSQLPEESDTVQTQKDCYGFLASANLDESYCEQITVETSKESCKKLVTYPEWVAIMKRISPNAT